MRAVTDLETVTGADAEYVAALVDAGIPLVNDGSAGRSSADPALRELGASLAAPIMHDKYLVFDGAAVWTGSTNLSVNDLTRNHNNALFFESVELAQVYQQDFGQMFAGQFAGVKTPSPTTTVDYAGTPVEIYFSPQDDPMQSVIAAVNGAQTTIDFAIFYFTDDALADALLAAHARGVRVRGLWDRLGAGNAFSEDERLCAGGVPVKIEDTPGILHHKFLALDAAGAALKVVTGSLNWTAAANAANSENTVIVHNAALAQAYAGAFQGMWDGLVEVEACNPEVSGERSYLPLVVRGESEPTPTATFPPPPPSRIPTPTPTATGEATATPTTTPTPTLTLAADVRLVRIVYNPPGDDVAGERVDLRNAGAGAVALNGWTIHDGATTPNTYTFPAFSLAGGAAVTVWVKAGTDSATDVYWGRASAVWNNDGDTATVKDGLGGVVDTCSYAGGGEEVGCE